MRGRSDIRSGGPARTAPQHQKKMKRRARTHGHHYRATSAEGGWNALTRVLSSSSFFSFSNKKKKDWKRPSASAADKEMRATVVGDITDSSRVLKEKEKEAEKELGIRLREKCQPFPSRNKWTRKRVKSWTDWFS